MVKDASTELEEKFEKLEQESINKHGFFIHYVVDPEDPLTINSHTHGLSEEFGHDDLQITLPINQNLVSVYFRWFVEQIKGGRKFLEGGIINANILDVTINLLLIQRTESGRQVLRIVFPDKHGNIEYDDLKKHSPFFAKQYE